MPQYPSRQDSQHYRTHTHFQEPPNVSYYHPPSNGGATSHTKQTPQQHQPPHAAASPAVQQHGNNLTREEIEEIEDRRRMQQQILRDKLLYAETHAPDPALTVKTTTNHGFALGAFDMSESLAIVEDLLDYFGENEGALDNLDETDQFNQAELMEAERNHLQRESLIRHLYDSEEDYIRTLIDMGRFYRQPMLLLIQQADHKKGTLSFGSGSTPKPIATKEEVQTLFGNLDELIRFHEGFRDALESRAKIWGPNQIISDILMEVIPNFKVYTKYYTNFHAALTTLDRIMRLPHYKKFQEQCVADNPPGTPSLHLMLATPLRRISMTREILCSICQATQSSHPDYRNLISAYELFCQVSEQTRLDRLHAQDQLALFDIQSSMVGFPEPIMIPNRRLVLRADLHKVDSSLALEPRTYYLMNDVLLYARFDPRKNIYTFKGMFDLLYTQVNNPEDNTTLPQLPNSIQIANAGRKQMIRCRSREEKNYWMETLKQAIEVVNNASDDPSAPLGDVLPLRKYATSIASDSTTTLATFAGQSSVQGGTGFNGGSSTGGPLSPMLSPPSGSSATMSGPIAPSVAGGVTNHSMRSRALSAFTNMTSTSSAGMDTQSLASSTDSQGRPKALRKPNPQADFYGCSFGVSFDVNLNEDNMPANSDAPARSLSATLQNGNNVSTTSVGTTSSSGSTTGSSILQAGMRTQQPLGAMLAAIPEDKLTPKQRKAKEALAKAVEARRQARLKEEAKRGKAVSPSSASVHSNGSNGGNNQKDDASTRQVNPDFSSSFIPVKVRRDVVGK
ncbi:hypothetical protein BGW42_002609 [Actinomortierella wolfii]|nr:hypothetical protein BGW42_002609 [Actinomortierella wolfii]